MQAQSYIVGVAGYNTPDDGFRHVIAATVDGGIHEIYFNPKSGTFKDNLSSFQNIVGIAGFITSDDGYQHVIVATNDGNISEVYFNPGIGIHVSHPALANFNGIIGI